MDSTTTTKDKTFNFLVTQANEGARQNFEKIIKNLKLKYPNLNYYFISQNYKSEIESLKSKNIDISLVLVNPFMSNLLPPLFESFPSINWVHTLSAGVDRYFRMPEFVKKLNSGMTLTNSAGAFSDSFGEAGITAMLYFSYNIYTYVDAMKNKNWIRPSTNKMLQNKKLLIMGYGNNGMCLAKRAKNGFDMKITGVVRTMRDNILGKEYVDELYAIKDLPDKAINEADFIYATLPSTPETINMFDKNFFAKMNKGAVFINIGRGTAVVEDDIIFALENNIIRGAVLDVTQKEPLEKESKLYNVSPTKLLITNHSLGGAIENREKGLNFFVKCLEYYLENGKYMNEVDKIHQY